MHGSGTCERRILTVLAPATIHASGTVNPGLKPTVYLSLLIPLFILLDIRCRREFTPVPDPLPISVEDEWHRNSHKRHAAE